MRVRKCLNNTRAGSVALVVCAVSMLSSCVTEETTRTPPPRNPVAATGSTQTPPSFPELNLNPDTKTLTVNVRAAIVLLGSVPYDNFALPIVSPNGRFIATEAGIAPTWDMILARGGGGVPEATRVEIHSLDLRVGIPDGERQQASLSAIVKEPVLLGRSCDREGFLVESPREDGSRWIGKASWETGRITWLVRDAYINAFAALGPDGRLAFSRRARDQAHYELVVRQGDQEWSYTTREQSWLLPTFSGRGNGLFVLLLRDGNLDLTFATASSKSTFRQSIRTTPLAGNSTLRTAYQTMSGQIGIIGLPRPTLDQVTFTHPRHLRASVWRPLALGASSPAILYKDSFAVVVDDSDIAFVSTPKNLMRQSLVDPRIHANVLAGTLIPRPIDSPNWHYVLLSPQEGRIGLSATRLLPPER